MLENRLGGSYRSIGSHRGAPIPWALWGRAVMRMLADAPVLHRANVVLLVPRGSFRRRGVLPRSSPPIGALVNERPLRKHASDCGTWHSGFLYRFVFCDLAAGLIGLMLVVESDMVVPHVVSASLTLATWVLALALVGTYGRRRLAIGCYQLRAVNRAALGLLLVVALDSYRTDFGFSRPDCFAVLAGLIACSMEARLMLNLWLRRYRASGSLMQRTVVVGLAGYAAALVRSIVAEPMQGLLPVVVCPSDLDGADHCTTHVGGIAVVGPPTDAIDAVDLCDAEVVVVAAHRDLSTPALLCLTWALEDCDAEPIVAPGLLDVAGPRLSIRPSRRLSMLYVERPSAVRIHVFAEPAIDRCCVAVLTVALSPLLIAAPPAVKLDDGQPVFFRHKRVGARGKSFFMFKFRATAVDAEPRLEGLLAASNDAAVLSKMRRVPRVTKSEGFQRRYSIDELPQLFNVAREEMSLVGPRPPSMRQVDQNEPVPLARQIRHDRPVAGERSQQPIVAEISASRPALCRRLVHADPVPKDQRRSSCLRGLLTLLRIVIPVPFSLDKSSTTQEGEYQDSRLSDLDHLIPLLKGTAEVASVGRDDGAGTAP